jgi:hypothetical protein
VRGSSRSDRGPPGTRRPATASAAHRSARVGTRLRVRRIACHMPHPPLPRRWLEPARHSRNLETGCLTGACRRSAHARRDDHVLTSLSRARGQVAVSALWRASEDRRSCHPLAGALQVDALVESSAVAHRGRAVTEDLHLRRVAASVAHDHGPNPSRRGAGIRKDVEPTDRVPFAVSGSHGCTPRLRASEGGRQSVPDFGRAGAADLPALRDGGGREDNQPGSLRPSSPAASRHGAAGATHERRPA